MAQAKASGDLGNTVRIRFVLDQPHGRFGTPELQSFLSELATVLQVPPTEFQDVQLRSGCVVVDISLDPKLAALLFELIEKTKTNDQDPQTTALRNVLQSQRVKMSSIGYSLLIIEKPRRGLPDRRVILVHGWRGSSKSFGKLPELVATNFGCACMRYEYPTRLSGNVPPLNAIVDDFDNWIRNHAIAERIAIIAHSYGGHVTRQMLNMQISRREESLSSKIRSLTFVASPFTGAYLADLANKVSGVRRLFMNEQEKDLTGFSALLVDVNRMWALWCELHGKTCHIRSVFSHDDVIVPAASAAVGDAQAIGILGRAHEDIVRITSEKDEMWVTLARLLREADFDLRATGLDSSGIMPPRVGGSEAA